jgi:hypothetical protein
LAEKKRREFAEGGGECVGGGEEGAFYVCYIDELESGGLAGLRGGGRGCIQ